MQTKNILAAIERDRRLRDISKRRAGELLGCRSPAKNAQISFYNSFLAGTAITLAKLQRIGRAFHRSSSHYLRASYTASLASAAPVAAESRATYGRVCPDRLSPTALTAALKKLAQQYPQILGDAAADTFSPAAARAILRAWRASS